MHLESKIVLFVCESTMVGRYKVRQLDYLTMR